MGPSSAFSFGIISFGQNPGSEITGWSEDLRFYKALFSVAILLSRRQNYLHWQLHREWFRWEFGVTHQLGGDHCDPSVQGWRPASGEKYTA